MLPGVRSLEEGLRVYEKFPGAHRAKHFGVIAIGVRVIDDKFSETRR